MRHVNDTRQTPTSAPGHWGRCDCCNGALWLESDRKPGPDLCSQECFDDHNERAARRVPVWAVEG